MLFLIKMCVNFPENLTEENRLVLRQREAEIAKELALEGSLLKLWRSDANCTTWGIWQTSDFTAVQMIIERLPLYKFMKTNIHQLSEHPNDPNLIGMSAAT